MTIELRETEITALIRKGLLKDDARNDLQAVRKAFTAFWIGRWIRDPKQGTNVTRNRRDHRLTIEMFVHDCLDLVARFNDFERI